MCADNKISRIESILLFIDRCYYDDGDRLSHSATVRWNPLLTSFTDKNKHTLFSNNVSFIIWDNPLNYPSRYNTTDRTIKDVEVGPAKKNVCNVNSIYYMVLHTAARSTKLLPSWSKRDLLNEWSTFTKVGTLFAKEKETRWSWESSPSILVGVMEISIPRPRRVSWKSK